MADKIIIGKNGNEHGIWVSRPGQAVRDGGPYLMSSVGDMLKIHAQGSISSYSDHQSIGLWRHDIEVAFPELPFIPLAFMGLKTSDSEPFQFPPVFNSTVTSVWFEENQLGMQGVIPTIGISHNKLKFFGWTVQRQCYFNYTVFLLKIRERF